MTRDEAEGRRLRGDEVVENPDGERGVQTIYRGPTRVAKLKFGDVAVRLLRPCDPDLLLDDPLVTNWNRRDDYMPYWAYLWPAAYILAERIACDPALKERERPAQSAEAEVLEIGCGLGLAGLVAVACGFRVQFTDYDEAPLDFVVRSAAENEFEPARFSTRRLDWRAMPDEEFSLILGADVIYEARLIPLVANLLKHLLAPGGLGLIASPDRVAAKQFPNALTTLGLNYDMEPATAFTEEGQRIDGTIYRVWK